MGRGKGSLSRKECETESLMVGRRPIMELISPLPAFAAKRASLSASPSVSPSDPLAPPIPLSYKRAANAGLQKEQPPSKRLRTGHLSSPPVALLSPPHASSPVEWSHDDSFTKAPQAFPQSAIPNQPTIPNFLYAPFRGFDLDKVFSSSRESTGLAKVHIAVEHLTANNPAIRLRNLWGSGRYTDDSDLVAVLLHTGMYHVTVHAPKTFQYLSVLIQLEKHINGVSEAYPLAMVKGFTSRSWGSKYEGASMTVLSVAMVSLETVTIPSQRSRRKTTVRPHRLIPWNHSASKKAAANASTSNATLGTYPRDGKLEAKQAVVSGTMSFDMVNEPCLVYDIKELASLRYPKAVFDRLQTETLYAEDGDRRFEISWTEAPSSKSSVRRDPNMKNMYVRFAEVLKVTLQTQRVQNAESLNDEKMAGSNLTTPLATKDLKVIVKKIPWSELVWDCKGVTVQGLWYELITLSFRKNTVDR